MASQTWVFREFPGPHGPADAVVFLNEPARQGHGEANANARNNGTAGLFYLEPGSLGSSTAQTWVFRDFPGPHGPADAVAFLNQPARQGPGEASAEARNNGTAGLFYLEPGSLGSGTQQTWVLREFPGPAAAAAFLNEPARQGPGEASAEA